LVICGLSGSNHCRMPTHCAWWCKPLPDHGMMAEAYQIMAKLYQIMALWQNKAGVAESAAGTIWSTSWGLCFHVDCREFLEPMLLVTLFAPASQLSAAAALAALYYFVLAHQVTCNHSCSACFLLLSADRPQTSCLEVLTCTQCRCSSCRLCSVC